MGQMALGSLGESLGLLSLELLGDDQVRALLAPVGFADWRNAYDHLRRLADRLQPQSAFARCLPQLLKALGSTASPDRVLVNLERLAHSAADPLVLCRSFVDEPRLLDMLVTLFAGSQFLSEILLRDPSHLRSLQNPQRLAEPKSPQQLYAEAQAAIAPGMETEGGGPRGLSPLDALRRFQRSALLRIGAGDLLGLLDLPTVTMQLSHLADSLVQLCLTLVAAQAQTPTDGFAVVALGKLGGGELNYSSDIDLLFLAASSSELYRQLGERLVDALARVTAEGFLYRVDLRLRPWGRTGPLVSTLESYMAYLRQHARPWEKQALLKARVVAGDVALGKEFLDRTAPLLFDVSGRTRDLRSEVREMKERIEADLRRRGREWGEVKLGRGSIRDVEFVTQYLQLSNGAQHPEIRSANTLHALARLSAAGLLAAEDYRVLADGYTFLRPVEHYLQMMHNQQIHLLPADARELNYLARRLGFQGGQAGELFLARYQQHSSAIRAVYQRCLEGSETKMPGDSSPVVPDVRRHLARMVPSYGSAFTAEEIRRHAELAGRLDDDNLVEVEANSLDGGYWRVTIVGYDYTGELSIICGLLFVYGFNIRDGHAFTYEPLGGAPQNGSVGSQSRGARYVGLEAKDLRRKIVDVFNVRSVTGEVAPDLWARYATDLAVLLQHLQVGELHEAQGKLTRRVAETLRAITGGSPTLYPVDIEINNEVSDRYTVLYIDAPDTIGFLYEFTNALALSGVHIAQVMVDSTGNRAHDTLYLTDSDGHKITTPEKQRELRAATVLVKHFTRVLPHSPNPESALLHFRELLGQLFMNPDWPDELASLERPEVLSALARLLGVSDFLWDDFLRMQYTNLFPVVRDVQALATSKTREQLQAEMSAALLVAPDGGARRAALNALKDREMFRIDMRHIQGHIAEFRQFSVELTDLAEVIMDGAYRLCEEGLRTQYGAPLCENGAPCPLAICALGKCGGRELGFASDIELMFVFAGNGETSGPTVISSAEFYERLVQRFLETIRAKREGIFEIDLQLRPYGKAGSMAVSLSSFRRYFAPGGPAWPYERQALIKLRPIAGDVALGKALVELRDEYIYGGEPFDVTAMRAMRERQLRHLVTASTVNAKFSPGGLVDVEYLVQALQMRHGQRNASLRCPNTDEAIAALAAAEVLTPDEHRRLSEAHTWLRRLIDALRIVRGNARDLTVPPADSEEFAFLARRLGYGDDLARLRADLAQHTSNVLELGKRFLT